MNDRDDLIQQLATQIHRYDLELERLERLQGVFAVGMVKVCRLAQAMNAEVEQLKDHMAGITPHGFEPAT